MLRLHQNAANHGARKSVATAEQAVVWRCAVCCLVLWSVCGCARIKQTAELWSEQRQLTQRAREAQEQGDVSGAANLLAQAVDADPRNCETRLELSELLMEHGSLESAIQNLHRVVAQNPDDPRGYVKLAQALTLQKRDSEVEPLLRTALEIDPGNPTGLLMFAQWLERQGEMRQALDTYYRAIPMLSDPSEAELRIAAIKLRAGQTAQATALLRSVTDNSHACPRTKAESYALLGRAYSNEHRWRDAAVAFETGFKLQPHPPTAVEWQFVADIYARAGDLTASSRCAAAASGRTLTASAQQPNNGDGNGFGPVSYGSPVGNSTSGDDY